VEEKTILLHVCCAPDATVPWVELQEEGYSVVPYWYGSNIHPPDEEQRRREAFGILAARMNSGVLREPYAPEAWLREAFPLAGEPEGGVRCALCFFLQLESAARRACEEGIPLLCTTLTISPHKDALLINKIGAECAARYGITWLDRVFRKRNGFVRSVALSKEFGLYRQSYCGCIYSMTRGGNVNGKAGRGEAFPVST
jgi:hypothetical protein